MKLVNRERCEERFMRYVNKAESGCWLWTGNRKTFGYDYGLFFTGRRGHTMSAHRASWELFRGEIPSGLCVLHTCDIPRCVNPGHLFLGTVKDNVRDMFQKGRQSKQRGEHNHNATLTAEQAANIRRDPRRNYLVAREYGVSWSTVADIKRGRSWKHLPNTGTHT